VVELAYTADLKSVAERFVGSSPTTGTRKRRIMAITPAFQAGDAGSIPVACSKFAILAF